MKDFEKSYRLGYVVAAVAIVMMVFGICRGETAIVLKKAVNICLECVGIG